MKKISLLFLLLCFSYRALLYSQSNSTDSLKQVWNSTSYPDSVRFKAMDDYIWEAWFFTNADSAIHYSNQLYIAAQLKQMPASMAVATNYLGAIYGFKGEFEKAKRYGKQTLEIHTKLNNVRGMASANNNLGSTCRDVGDYENAAVYFKKSLELYRSIQNKNGILSVLNNLGLVYKDQGNFNLALKNYNESYELSKADGNVEAMGSVTGNIANIYKDQGDYEMALKYYELSLSHNEKGKDIFGRAYVFNNMGILFGYVNELKKSSLYHRKALNIIQGLGYNSLLAHVLYNIGNNYYEEGAVDSAFYYYDKAFAFALTSGEKNMISLIINGKGRLSLKQKKYDEAARYAQEALVYCDSVNYIKEKNFACQTLAQVYIEKNNVDSARFYLDRLKEINLNFIRQNFFALSESEKEKFIAILENTFHIYYGFAIANHGANPGLADSALNLMLSLKGISLFSSVAIRKSVLESGDSSLINLYEKLLQLKRKELSDSQNGESNHAADMEIVKLENSLAENSPAFKQLIQTGMANWKHIQSNLNKGEVAIEFVRYSIGLEEKNKFYKYSAIIVKQNIKHPEIIELGTEAEMDLLLKNIQYTNGQNIREFYAQKNTVVIYEKFWGLLEPSIKGAQTIYYSPAGLLYKLSLPALSIGNNDYLVDRYNFIQVLSLNECGKQELKNTKQANEFVLVGGVDYGVSNDKLTIWDYLPGTLSEISGIEKLLLANNSKCNVLKGKSANETNVKESIQKAQVIHLSTHGFSYGQHANKDVAVVDLDKDKTISFRGSNQNMKLNFASNPDVMMRSGLVLADANRLVVEPVSDSTIEDGVLTAREVTLLNLSKVELVVLSACETALGDVAGAEGVFGLQRAFKISGANNLIVSLWQVPDTETAEFMQLFYKSFTGGNSVQRAFFKAQKAMRKKYEAYYWGAFVLLN